MTPDEPTIADEIEASLRKCADEIRAERLRRLAADLFLEEWPGAVPGVEPLTVPEWDGDYEDA